MKREILTRHILNLMQKLDMDLTISIEHSENKLELNCTWGDLKEHTQEDIENAITKYLANNPQIKTFNLYICPDNLQITLEDHDTLTDTDLYHIEETEYPWLTETWD